MSTTTPRLQRLSLATLTLVFPSILPAQLVGRTVIVDDSRGPSNPDTPFNPGPSGTLISIDPMDRTGVVRINGNSIRYSYNDIDPLITSTNRDLQLPAPESLPTTRVGSMKINPTPSLPSINLTHLREKYHQYCNLRDSFLALKQEMVNAQKALEATEKTLRADGSMEMFALLDDLARDINKSAARSASAKDPGVISKFRAFECLLVTSAASLPEEFKIKDVIIGTFAALLGSQGSVIEKELRESDSPGLILKMLDFIRTNRLTLEDLRGFTECRWDEIPPAMKNGMSAIHQRVYRLSQVKVGFERTSNGHYKRVPLTGACMETFTRYHENLKAARSAPTYPLGI